MLKPYLTELCIIVGPSQYDKVQKIILKDFIYVRRIIM